MVRVCPSNQLISLPAFCAAVALLVVVRRPSECHANPILWIGPGLGPQNWLPRQRPLRNRKTYFGSFVYGQSYTNPANLVKIGLVDVEIIGLMEIVKKETAAEHTPIFG